MYLAVTTRYAGPTNTRGARIFARSVAGTKTVPWNRELDTFANHEAAAVAVARAQHVQICSCCERLSADLPGGRGYVFLFAG